jgi:hypothetical protein
LCQIALAEPNPHITPGWKVQRRGIRLDHAHPLEGISLFDLGPHLVELAQIGAKPNENPALPVELADDQVARDREVQAARNGESLRAADRMAVVAERRGVCEHLAVAAGLDERGAYRTQPRERVERNAHRARPPCDPRLPRTR